MKIQGKYNNIENIEVSMTITMTIAEWEKLCQQMTSNWPSWEVAQAISLFVDKAKSGITI